MTSHVVFMFARDYVSALGPLTIPRAVPYGRFSKVQSGKMGPDSGIFELLKDNVR